MEKIMALILAHLKLLREEQLKEIYIIIREMVRR